MCCTTDSDYFPFRKYSFYLASSLLPLSYIYCKETEKEMRKENDQNWQHRLKRSRTVPQNKTV